MSELTGLALGLNQDGRMEVVATGQKGEGVGAIWHGQQSSHGWSDWTQLGQPGSGVFADAGPAVARNADGRLEVAAIGNDLAVWHARQGQPGGDWSQWHSLGLPGGKEVISSQLGARPPGPTPTLVGNADGLLEVFAVRSDLTVWHRKQRPDGGWSDWATLRKPGDGTLGPLAAAANADGRLELFATDSEGAVWHCWQREPGHDWSQWRSMKSPEVSSVRSRLAATQNQDGRLELFAAHLDSGAVCHRSQRPEGGWSQWRSLGRKGHGFEGVAVAANLVGCLVLFATELDSSNGLWQRQQTIPGGDWSPWDSLSDLVSFDDIHGPIADPTLALGADRHLQAVLRISGIGEMYHLLQGAEPTSLHSWAVGLTGAPS
jgi:hypothetical protein